MLLSILIPAYRRPELLRKTLKSITKALKPNNEFSVNHPIEVLVGDDSGLRLNKPIVEYEKKFFGNNFELSTIETSGGIGFEKNFIKLLRHAKGQYVFFIGEDDLIHEDFFVNVFRSLVKKDLIILNYFYISNDYKYKSNFSLFGNINKMSVDELIKKHFFKLGFMGSFIIKKHIILKYLENCPSNTWFPHIYVISSYLKSNNINEVLVTKPIVFNRAENSSSFTWSDKAFENLIGYRMAFQFGTGIEDVKMNEIDFGFLRLESYKKAVIAASEYSSTQYEKFIKCYRFKYRLAAKVTRTVILIFPFIGKLFSYLRRLKFLYARIVGQWVSLN